MPITTTPNRPKCTWFALVCAILGLALLGLWQSPSRINHDCAMYLQEAELLLDGQIPYADFIELNPPLVIYLNVLPVAIARTLHVSPIVSFQVFIIFLLGLSALEIHAILEKRRMGLHPSEILAILLAWMLPYFLFDYRADLGQREHLFILLYIPYLFLRILRHRGGGVSPWFALLLGLQAGLGTSLKPHFLLAAVVVELILLWDSRRWSVLLKPENFSLAIVVLAYLAHWLFVPQSMRENFFHRWLPMIYGGYDVYNRTYWEITQSIFTSPISIASLFGILSAILIASQRPHLRNLLLGIAALGIASFMLIFIQHKGWNYHRIPLETAGVMCIALTLIVKQRDAQKKSEIRIHTTNQPTSSENWKKTVAFSLLSLVAAVIWLTQRSTWAVEEPADYAQLRQIIESHTQPDDPVLFIATSVRPAYPMLLQTGRKPGSRYLCCFPIAFFYANDRGSEAQPHYRRLSESPPEENRFLHELCDDVLRNKPRLIIIPASPGWQALPPKFNTFEYLQQSGWTEKALSAYHEIPSPTGWKVLGQKEQAR